MEKKWNIGIVLCTGLVAVIFWLLAGSQFIKLRTGARPLEQGECFEDAEGEYISYEALYPAASWVEKYDSNNPNDPDKAEVIGYVVYDVDRNSFLCIIGFSQDTKGFDGLMRKPLIPAEGRIQLDILPVAVKGSLEPANQKQIDSALEALENCEIKKLYKRSLKSDDDMRIYFEEDEFGKVLGRMCEDMLADQKQAQWYVIEPKKINHLNPTEISICTITAIFNFLIFVFGLLGMLMNGTRDRENMSKISENMPEQFLAQHMGYVKAWCAYNLKKGYRFVTLSMVIALAIFVGIGILSKNINKIIVLYVPLGFIIGEVMALLFWWGQKTLSNQGKILKRMKKNLMKEIPDNTLRNAFIEEFVNTENAWAFEEQTKESMQWGKVGEKYWSIFFGDGRVRIVDAARLGEVETETVSGTMPSGKVWISYIYYMVRFYYQSESNKRKCDKSFSFNIEDNIGFFMTLVRKRVGSNDSVRITRK